MNNNFQYYKNLLLTSPYPIHWYNVTNLDNINEEIYENIDDNYILKISNIDKKNYTKDFNKILLNEFYYNKKNIINNDKLYFYKPHYSKNSLLYQKIYNNIKNKSIEKLCGLETINGLEYTDLDVFYYNSLSKNSLELKEFYFNNNMRRNLQNNNYLKLTSKNNFNKEVNKNNDNNILKIGFISSDFGVHPVASLIRNMLKLLTNAYDSYFQRHKNKFIIPFPRIKVYCFTTNPILSWWGVDISNEIDSFEVIQLNLTSPSASTLNSSVPFINEYLHSLKLHALFDLNGLTIHSSLLYFNLFQYPLADIQLTYLGLPTTTEMLSVDYFLSDEISLDIDNVNNELIEQVFYLKNLFYIVNDFSSTQFNNVLTSNVNPYGQLLINNRNNINKMIRYHEKNNINLHNYITNIKDYNNDTFIHRPLVSALFSTNSPEYFLLSNLLPLSYSTINYIHPSDLECLKPNLHYSLGVKYTNKLCKLDLEQSKEFNPRNLIKLNNFYNVINKYYNKNFNLTNGYNKILNNKNIKNELIHIAKHSISIGIISNNSKLKPEFFDLVANILRRLPGAHLFVIKHKNTQVKSNYLKKQNIFTQNNHNFKLIRSKLKKQKNDNFIIKSFDSYDFDYINDLTFFHINLLSRGVLPDQITLLSQISWIDHIYSKSSLDIILDSTLKNLHSSALDGIWAGVPIISLGQSNSMNTKATTSLSYYLSQDNYKKENNLIGFIGSATSIKDYENIVFNLLTKKIRIKKTMKKSNQTKYYHKMKILKIDTPSRFYTKNSIWRILNLWRNELKSTIFNSNVFNMPLWVDEFAENLGALWESYLTTYKIGLEKFHFLGKMNANINKQIEPLNVFNDKVKLNKYYQMNYYFTNNNLMDIGHMFSYQSNFFNISSINTKAEKFLTPIVSYPTYNNVYINKLNKEEQEFIPYLNSHLFINIGWYFYYCFVFSFLSFL